MTRRTRRWIAVPLLVALGLALAVAGALLAVGRATVAELSGSSTLVGLHAPVEIVRDSEAIPHVFAAAIDDLYAGLGFAHAQDRLWQMELMRRAGQGRLSEVFGERTLNADIFMRTLDLYRHSERALATLSKEARGSLEAYARGVNGWLGRSTRRTDPRWPPEFLLLRHRPEPWRAADSLVILKVMSLSLSMNFEHELTRLSYAAQGLGPAEIDDLMPPQDPKTPPLPDIRSLYPLQQPTKTASGSPHLVFGGASNNWVVSGARTRTGAPLLANDPHLRLTAPSTWYFAHLALSEPGRTASNVAGATLPGVPLVVLGRSDAIAWGFTNTGADVQDIFIEKVNPERSDEYLTPSGWQRFEIEPMPIRVKGAATVTVQRRRTRHGPVLPGTYRNLQAMLAPGYVAAMQWTALDDNDTTFAAGLFDPKVRTVEEYFQHMRTYVVPVQSMVVADKTGTIGLIAPGRIPVRKPGNRVSGRAPVPGWDATYDWTGHLSFEALPHSINPPDGAIGTANASIVGGDYPHMITLDWDAPFRQQRVSALVVDRSGHDVDSMQAAQHDVYSLAVARLKSLMIAAARTADRVDTRTLDRLAAWDDTMRADLAEPLIFMAWLRESVRAIWADDLGPTFDRFFAPRALAFIRLLEGRANGRDWCDDRATVKRDTCGSLIARALDTALGDLAKRYGTDRRRWRWGDAHFADNEHRGLGTLPVLGWLFNVHVPSPGGPYTLNRGQVDFGADQPYANRGAASCRAIYDLSDLDASLFIHTTGQSGNPFSPFYRSFAERWSRGEYLRIPTRREDVERIAIGRWHLTAK